MIGLKLSLREKKVWSFFLNTLQLNGHYWVIHTSIHNSWIQYNMCAAIIVLSILIKVQLLVPGEWSWRGLNSKLNGWIWVEMVWSIKIRWKERNQWGYLLGKFHSNDRKWCTVLSGSNVNKPSAPTSHEQCSSRTEAFDWSVSYFLVLCL